jgi:hypothetical protein
MQYLKFWGWGLVTFSFIPWMLLPTIPWWPLSIEQKLLASGVLLTIAELLFWAGALIVGKQAISKYRKYFTWRRLQALWQKLRWPS